MTDTHDPRYLEGIRLFNECEFFEAHEVWEELWQEYVGPARRFYQGLIQAAVCLHHFGNGNTRGAKKLYHSCRGYLNEYAPSFEGIDLVEFLAQLHECCRPILENSDDYPKVEIDAERIPEIHLKEE